MSNINLPSSSQPPTAQHSLFQLRLNNTWGIIVVSIFILLIIAITSIVLYSRNLTVKRVSELPTVINYFRAVTGVSDSIDTETIQRSTGEPGDYIKFNLDIADRKYELIYRINSETRSIDEIDVFSIQRNTNEIDTYQKMLVDGFFNNFDYVIGPDDWSVYQDPNHKQNQISETIWVRSDATKEVRGVYIDMSSGTTYLFACKLFRGSPAYEQNTCMVR